MMRCKTNRDAFSLITAIFTIILMASVAMFIMNVSGKLIKETSTQYQREQSMLLANSYLEYGIMAVTANEHNKTNCLNYITGKYAQYDVNVTVSYIGNDKNLGSGSSSNCANVLSKSVVTKRSPLNIILDVFVSYDDDDTVSATPNKITYHKRKLVKI